MSAVTFLWALSVKVPENLIPDVMAQLPEDEVSQSCFKANGTAQDDHWIIETHYKAAPELGLFSTALSVLAASQGAPPYDIQLQKIPAKGWLKANLESFPPIYAGRFVIHGKKDRAGLPSHLYGIEMETSAAFGTGEHPTTHGCLMMLQTLPALKRHQHAFDLGAGSGILALALAQQGQPLTLASDMDAESVAVAIGNVHHNRTRGVVRVVKAEGFKNRMITKKKPYDLVVSNIFARPLAKLAPALRKHLKLGGRVILAGFLHKDVPMVLRAYAQQRIHFIRRAMHGNWSILLLSRPDRRRKSTA